MKLNCKKIVGSVMKNLSVLLLVIGVISTASLFILDRDIQNLYERKNSLDIAYAEFLGLHPLTLANPWQGLSDEYLQLAYRNCYFSVYGKEPSREILSKVESRASYIKYIKELLEVPETQKAKNIILDKLKKKQSWQLVAFWVLILSQLVGVYFGVRRREKGKNLV